DPPYPHPLPPLPLHDALPISAHRARFHHGRIVEAPGATAPVVLAQQRAIGRVARGDRRAHIVAAGTIGIGLGVSWLRTHGREQRSEEHTSELQSHVNLVCLLL